MAKKRDKPAPKIKIKRERRRLYDPVSEETEIDSKNMASEPFHGESKEVFANKIIKNYVIWSSGTALIPVPILDMAAVTAVQVKMLKRLCDYYGMEFSNQRGKALIASLIGGFHAGLIAGSLLKAVPVLGLAGAVASTTVATAALTYAVGKVFVYHFEAGGTLLDFNPARLREYFDKKFSEGKKAASGLEN